jgi:hypothetical protein
MSGSDVTKEGLRNVRPGREATTGVVAGRDLEPGDGARASRSGSRRRSGGEQPMVPKAEFRSYYGQPILNEPTWKSPDIPGYLYCGGLAGAASVLAAGAEATGRPGLARWSKLGAAGAVGLGMVGLVHDLGKPSRFLNMLRVFKPTSPMSVGSWLLAGYVPAAGAAALAALTGRFRLLGAAGTAAAAALGPAVASYTGALLASTAVPAWHEGYRELPFVFAGSAAMAAGGLGLLAAPVAENGPAARLAAAGAAGDLIGMTLLGHREGMVAEPYSAGRPGAILKAGKALSIAGAAGALIGRRSRPLAALSGLALLAGSACTKWGVFEAGRESARDPRYTVVPQRERLGRRPA